jgi:hypothetical protein
MVFFRILGPSPSMSSSNLTSFQKRREEVETIQRATIHGGYPSANMLWTYPYVGQYHITDSIIQVDGERGVDAECILHTFVEHYSAIHYCIWFMDKYKVAKGILDRPVWKRSYSAIWYNTPPDEKIQILFEGQNRLRATMQVKDKKDVYQNLSEQVEVSPENPIGWLHYQDISANLPAPLRRGRVEHCRAPRP